MRAIVLRCARGFLLATLLLALAAIPSLVAAESGGHGALWTEVHELECLTLEQGMDGTFERPVLLYLESAEDWDRAMLELETEGAIWATPLPTAPEYVDWSREGVVLVSFGRMIDQIFTLEVTAAREWNHELLLDLSLAPDGYDNEKHLFFPYCVATVEKCCASEVRVRTLSHSGRASHEGELKGLLAAK